MIFLFRYWYAQDDIAAAASQNSRDLLLMSIARRRREFNSPYMFSDKDSTVLTHELDFTYSRSELMLLTFYFTGAVE